MGSWRAPGGLASGRRRCLDVGLHGERRVVVARPASRRVPASSRHIPNLRGTKPGKSRAITPNSVYLGRQAQTATKIPRIVTPGAAFGPSRIPGRRSRQRDRQPNAQAEDRPGPLGQVADLLGPGQVDKAECHEPDPSTSRGITTTSGFIEVLQPGPPVYYDHSKSLPSGPNPQRACPLRAWVYVSTFTIKATRRA